MLYKYNMYTFSDEPREGAAVQMYTPHPLYNICVNIDYIQRSCFTVVSWDTIAAGVSRISLPEQDVIKSLSIGMRNVWRKFVNLIRDSKHRDVVSSP